MTSPGFFFTILAFLLVIGPLIFIHELGHYFAGRAFGVKAEAFSIGFGREIFGWTDKRGTRWKVGWMPLGGYVRFKGDMNPASVPSEEWLALPPAERAETFQAKTVWQRFIIVLAGPLVNFLFAILVYVALFATYGEPRTPAVIAGITPDSAASQAGMEIGDRILSIDGSSMSRFEKRTYVALRPGQPMRFDIVRQDQSIVVQAAPQALQTRDRFGNEARVGRLGIERGGAEVVSLQPHQAVGAASAKPPRRCR